MNTYPPPIPVNIITGFLGSGKTSIVQQLLASPELEETAVLVNEFGEIGLDHHLFKGLTESTILMQNGCVCCAIRGDLNEGLRDLFSQMTRGEIPAFRRVIIETSGMADPVPIAYTIQTEPVVRHHYRLGNIVTAVDAVSGQGQLQRYSESVKQAAIADRIIVTKTDLVEKADVEQLITALRRFNAAAQIQDGNKDRLDPVTLFATDSDENAPADSAAPGWFSGNATGITPGLDHEHAGSVHSFTITYETPIDWTAFGIWMTMLLHRHGDKILRIKGLLNVDGMAAPVLINGVQHVVHAPDHLTGWPDGDRRSRLVFIVDGIDQSKIAASLDAFNCLANPAVPA